VYVIANTSNSEHPLKILAISGSGIGAGKTTLAKRLCKDVWSLAGAMRAELERIYPGYDWFNKDQAYKANTVIKEYKRGQSSMRQVLIEHGQDRCVESPTYWVETLSNKILSMDAVVVGITTVAIDDIRKVSEIEHLRRKFKDVTHIHIDFHGSVREAEFENDDLLEISDYVVQRK
jgi:hypothetical protein